MGMQMIKKYSATWVENDPAATPEVSYDTHVQKAIAQGRAQLDAGQGILAAQVWEELRSNEDCFCAAGT